jgi:hypothetical protein
MTSLMRGALILVGCTGLLGCSQQPSHTASADRQPSHAREPVPARSMDPDRLSGRSPFPAKADRVGISAIGLGRRKPVRYCGSLIRDATAKLINVTRGRPGHGCLRQQAAHCRLHGPPGYLAGVGVAALTGTQAKCA